MKLSAIVFLALLAPALRAAEDLVSVNFDKTPAKTVVQELAKLEAKKAVLQLDSTAERRPIRLSFSGVPRDQAASLIRYALSAAGILIENRPDGSLLAIVGAAPTLGAAGSAGRADDGTQTFELSNVSVDVVARRVASLESKKFETGTDPEVSARTVTAKVERAMPATAATTLRAVLREQGGVALDEQPRGTLRLRVVGPPASPAADFSPAARARLPGPPAPPDTPVAEIALRAAPVGEVIAALRQVSGWDIAVPADVLASDTRLDFQVRAATPAAEAAAALRTALIEQAGVILDDEPGGKLYARLLPKPTPLFQNR
jgi:hypothetical protein